MATGKQLEAIINRYDRALDKAEAATIDRLTTALESAYRALEGRLLSAYRTQSGNLTLLPRQRTLLIMQEVQQYLTLLNPTNRDRIERDFEGLLRDSYEGGLSLSAELTQAIANGTLQSFAAVPLEAVRFQAQESSRRLYRWSEEMRSRISGIVEGHLVMGSGPQVVARSLRNELGILKGRAEAIARTESLASLNLAAQENYRRNGVEFVQVQVTRDDRLCPICAARSGNVYELGQIRIPLHVNCRCYTLPYRKEWAELGLTNDDWHREFRREAIAELRANGKEPNTGLSPFEKSEGLKAPPVPVWTPGQ